LNRQSAKDLLVEKQRCPTCRRDIDPADTSAYPFCSDRCRTIDLGNWLGETYRIPTKESPDEHSVGDDTDDPSN
jgi:endogenous inhibitor of DNA gyrase (YacG/DUF329 family)